MREGEKEKRMEEKRREEKRRGEGEQQVTIVYKSHKINRNLK